MTKEEINKWLDVANNAVVMAGKFLSMSDNSSRKVRGDFSRDIKILADIQSERLILNYLKKESDFSILSEEKGLIKGMNKSFTWIVDPLDGSFNFARRIPFCCVSVGLWKDGAPVLGAVYELNSSGLFSGIAGIGAWLNKHPLKVSDISQKKKAVLCTGFPANTDFSLKGIQRFVNNIRSYKKVRLLGSAALSIAYVAFGKVDAYYEENIMIWDIGGAIPILLGAGGRLEMKKGPMDNSFNVYASNGSF